MPLIDHKTLKQRNAGKVQFNTVREETLALLGKGHSRRALHAVLRENGLFTGSYRRFCEYVQGIEKRERGKKTPEAAPAPLEKVAAVTPDNPAPQPMQPEKPASAQQTERLEKPTTGGFFHTNTPNISDLF